MNKTRKPPNVSNSRFAAAGQDQEVMIDVKAYEPYSTLTCPQCGNASKNLMPTDACQFFYDCLNCGAVLTPNDGDCCVYCSYGDIKCPPIQQGNSNCC